MRARTLALAISMAALACDSPSTGDETSQKSASPTKVATAPPKVVPVAESPRTSTIEKPRQLWQQIWATPTGQPTTRVAAVRDGRVYAIAGPFMEHGTPASHLVALAADSGALLWTHADDQPLTLEGASEKLLDVGREGGMFILDAATGEPVTANKADSDATKPIERAQPEGCTITGKTIDCGAWTVTEFGTLHELHAAGDRVCYAIAGSREGRDRSVRCRDAKSGNHVFSVTVPDVPDVKHPEAVNFSVHVVGERLFVGNYDGTVLAYGPIVLRPRGG